MTAPPSAGANAAQTQPVSRLGAGVALAAAGAVAFSGKAIIIKLAYRHNVDAVTLLMLRMALALPLFALLAWWAGRGKRALSWGERGRVAALGFCGYYLASFLDFMGLQYISASLERLILYLNPTLVLLLGAAFFGKPIVRAQLGALAVSYAGVLLVFGHELSLAGARVGLGAALVFGAALFYALYLLNIGPLVQRLGALRLTGLSTLVACVLCVLQFFALRPAGLLLELDATVWWLSLLNALACTFAPVLMVMMAVERIGPVMTAQTGMIGPVSTVALGAWLLGEALTVWVLAGTLLVLVGVALLARAHSRVAPAAQP